MNDTHTHLRLPSVDVFALVGISIGYALWMKHWLGFVVLPLALLLPFVLRELDLVGDDERMREAWRRAGFWAFALFVAQGFVLFAVELLTTPDGRFLTTTGPSPEYIEVLRGPVIVFATVYLMTVADAGEGARKVLLVLALLAAVGWISDRITVGVHAGWDWVFVDGWWVRAVPALALGTLGWLAGRRPRLAGGLLLGCVAVGAVFFYLVAAPNLDPEVVTHGVVPAPTFDSRFIVAQRLSTDLALAVVALLLLRHRPEATP